MLARPLDNVFLSKCSSLYFFTVESETHINKRSWNSLSQDNNKVMLIIPPFSGKKNGEYFKSCIHILKVTCNEMWL